MVKAVSKRSKHNTAVDEELQLEIKENLSEAEHPTAGEENSSLSSDSRRTAEMVLTISHKTSCDCVDQFTKESCYPLI